ncbi:DUF2513 domain-containing protein [Truepera radiovictrix]|nr:DUF2513 domain-containing protein [Truepera radiovictrix]WMT57090.1 DUF2513 domain-containing protein [Truepera radiovictrix]
MLEIKNAPCTVSWVDIHLEGRTERDISYHVMQLAKAGLVEAEGTTETGSDVDWKANDLTWQGHDFLEAAEDDTIWQKAKKHVQEKGEALTFDVLKAVLTHLTRQAVGL